MLGLYEGIKLGSTDGEVIGTILGDKDVIPLELDIGTYMGSIDGPFDGSDDRKVEIIFLGDSLGSTDGKILSSDEGIKLVSTDSKVVCNILGDIDVITLGVDVGTYLSSLDRWFDGYNVGKLEGIFIGASLESTYGKVVGSD